MDPTGNGNNKGYSAGSGGEGLKQITVLELLDQCKAAIHRMGNSNPHKSLILNCAFAIRQLADRIYELEHGTASEREHGRGQG